MELGYGFTDLLLTSHAGLPAFAHLLKSARLRLDGAPQDTPDRLHEANLSLLQARGKPLANRLGFVPLDIDSTPMDNSGSHHEGVSYTCQGFDGFHPLLAYLGEQGYWLAQELRACPG